MLRTMLAATAALSLLAIQAHAQEDVTPAKDPDALFHSPNAKLNANKQVAYHIEKDLLEANHWELAGKYLSKAYHQHNPNAKSGLDGVVYYFTQVLKVQPKPIPAKMSTPVVAVMAEGDLVMVATRRQGKDSKGQPFETTWFDMWRIKDGKADEHWDGATRQ